jgi:hypothetical protein
MRKRGWELERRNPKKRGDQRRDAESEAYRGQRFYKRGAERTGEESDELVDGSSTT